MRMMHIYGWFSEKVFYALPFVCVCVQQDDFVLAISRSCQQNLKEEYFPSLRRKARDTSLSSPVDLESKCQNIVILVVIEASHPVSHLSNSLLKLLSLSLCLS